MYDYKEIKDFINELRLELDEWENYMKDSDPSKFYKKNNKSAGRRIRKILLLVQKRCRLIRNDIRRLTKEREIFKGTENESDYRREKRIDSSTS